MSYKINGYEVDDYVTEVKSESYYIGLGTGIIIGMLISIITYFAIYIPLSTGR